MEVITFEPLFFVAYGFYPGGDGAREVAFTCSGGAS